MIYYYKSINDYGEIKNLLTYENKRPNILNPLVVEITEEQYNNIFSEFKEKTELVYKVYYGEITISDVPLKWQNEIQSRVNEEIKMCGAYNYNEIPAEEFQTMIEEVL